MSDGITASLGIVGPERMDYARVASALKFVLDEMNEKLKDKGDNNGKG